MEGIEKIVIRMIRAPFRKKLQFLNVAFEITFMLFCHFSFSLFHIISID